MDDRIRLGPFELGRPLGAGGMGEVWSAEHAATGLPAAIKVVRSPLLGERLRRAFHTEVRASASLDHPSILRVLDAGEVPRAAAIASGGRLVAGSPYLVTERLPGRSLRAWVTEPRDWDQVRGVVLALLDALGHAHARGVVHRDVKPSNVLLDRQGLPRLTDFGIAHLHDAGGAVEHLGTPAYMAPEQFAPRWSPLGPATDLYALGATTWALVTGRPLFEGRGVDALRDAHLHRPLPPLRPVIDVPEGLEPLLARLLAKVPHARFARAREVAAALDALGPPTLLAVGVPLEPALADSTTLSRPTPIGHRTTSDVAPLDLDPPRLPPAEPVPVALPEAWAPEPVAFAGHLADAGLGLVGLRSVPLVGRRAERDALWDALRRAHAGEGPVAVVLQGPTGAGKSRLARWLAEQAHHLAAADVWTASHGPTEGAAEGVAPMIARGLGLAPGAGADQVVARCEAVLSTLPDGLGPDPEALAELAAPAGRVRFSRPEERYGLAAALLDRIAARRTVVIRLEDVQWGADALGLAAHLLDHGPPRLLLLLSARDEVLAERPLEAPRVASLLGHERASSLPVGPLPAPDRPAMVQAMLPLAPPLRDDLAERTSGNPLFAVQLVGDWVARGILAPGDGGFQLAEGASVELPGDLHAVWDRRLTTLLDGAHPSVHRALELAATLGLDVRGDEWAAVLAAVDLAVPWRLVERLLQERLANCPDGDPAVGWSFVHGMLREVVLLAAARAGRSQGNHGACADMLARRTGPGVHERRGHHLLEAARPAEAIGALLQAAAERIGQGQFGQARALLETWELAMRQARVGIRDPRWGHGWRKRYELAYQRGDFDEADVWSIRVEDHARWHGWAELEVRALLDRADVLIARGHAALARGLVDRARALPILQRDRSLRAACQLWDGVVRHFEGDATGAADLLRAARDGFLESGEGVQAADAARFVALAELSHGNALAGREAALEASRLFQRLGHRVGLGNCENTLGEACRALGDLAAASAHYAEARRLYRSLGLGRAVVPEANLAVLMLESGRTADARAVLERVASDPATRSRPAFRATVLALLLSALAESGDEVGWELLLPEARRTLSQHAPDRDGLAALVRARTAWAARGHAAHAEAAASLGSG